MSEVKGTTIPNFVTARSPKALRRLMLLTNKRTAMWHPYQIMWVESEKLWYAWFHEDVTRGLVNELVSDPTTNDVVVK